MKKLGQFTLIIFNRVRIWAKSLDAPVTSITLRSMQNKWASYSTAGRLTFDTELLKFHDKLQDYVIVHELLHYHVPNHGKLWRSLMRAHLGSYETYEAELQDMAAKQKDL